jgi:predicted glycoside hydrolase/deacetylase ChbG (UPF0249 family)
MHAVEVLDREYLDDTRYSVRVRRSFIDRFIEDLSTYTERRAEAHAI